jgi:lysophospholipase L1-like esterase
MNRVTRRAFFSSFALTAAAQSPPGYFEDLIAAMRVDWPKNETIRIAAHGHSVPAGYFKTPEVRTFDAYPHLFHAGLKQRFPNAVINVVVTARGGEDSASGAARFERDVLSLRPRLVTLDYGLNDRGMGLDRARAAWSSMIRKAVDAGSKVMLLTPTGDSRVADFLSDAELLTRHAAQIRELALEFRLPLADSHGIYQDHVRQGGAIADLLSHVNHPNRRGHELVALEMLRYFRS